MQNLGSSHISSCSQCISVVVVTCSHARNILKMPMKAWNVLEYRYCSYPLLARLSSNWPILITTSIRHRVKTPAHVSTFDQQYRSLQNNIPVPVLLFLLQTLSSLLPVNITYHTSTYFIAWKLWRIFYFYCREHQLLKITTFMFIYSGKNVVQKTMDRKYSSLSTPEV